MKYAAIPATYRPTALRRAYTVTVSMPKPISPTVPNMANWTSRRIRASEGNARNGAGNQADNWIRNAVMGIG